MSTNHRIICVDKTPNHRVTILKWCSFSALSLLFHRRKSSRGSHDGPVVDQNALGGEAEASSQMAMSSTTSGLSKGKRGKRDRPAEGQEGQAC